MGVGVDCGDEGGGVGGGGEGGGGCMRRGEAEAWRRRRRGGEWDGWGVDPQRTCRLASRAGTSSSLQTLHGPKLLMYSSAHCMCMNEHAHERVEHGWRQTTHGCSCCCSRAEMRDAARRDLSIALAAERVGDAVAMETGVVRGCDGIASVQIW